MKKLCTAGLALIFTFFSAITAVASSNTYELSELGLRVNIPAEYFVITRETSASDPVFSRFGITRAALMDQFKASDIYLNAVPDSANEEIVVTMTENSISDFNLFSDTALEMIISAAVEQYRNYGIYVLSYEIYQHSQAKFVKLYFSDPVNFVYGLQYYTIYNNKAMNFTMRSYSSPITLAQENTIKAVVDSIQYNTAPQTPEPVEDTSSFVYTDAESGVTYTVPDHWKQKELTEDREYIDVKFVSTKDAASMIFYGSTDFWKKIPSADRSHRSRSDFDNSVLTKEEVAEIYGVSSDKISLATYNGIQYYQAEIERSPDTEELNFSITTTQFMYIHNGWLYTFQFSGTSESEYFGDFVQLLNSVNYPAPPASSAAPSGTAAVGAGPVDSDYAVFGIILMIIILIIILIMAVIFSERKKLKVQRQNDGPKSVNFETEAAEAAGEEKTGFYCRNCGQPLPADSVFCYVCGTKIQKEEP